MVVSGGTGEILLLQERSTGARASYQGPAGTNRILIVDDEEVMLMLLRDVLGGEFCLVAVQTAEQAVPYLVHDPPDVVVVDKNLPGGSGLDLLKQAKALHPEVEVILITGYASLESAVEALRLGAYDYLIKPFDDIAIVLEKVRLAAEKKELSSERRQLMDQVMAANEELRAAQQRLQQGYLQTLTSMITALEARDAYTRGHSDRVAEFSAKIGKEMGLQGERYRNLVDGARLHDIGKIGIREEILNKSGRLTKEEFEHIQQHPDIGARILGEMEAYRHLVPMLRHHHERFDGKGYPDGLAGEDIPLEARIIAVADTFDAMTSKRPYREPRTTGEAIGIIREVAGSQLDPTAVGAFLMLQARLDST